MSGRHDIMCIINGHLKKYVELHNYTPPLNAAESETIS